MCFVWRTVETGGWRDAAGGRGKIDAGDSTRKLECGASLDDLARPENLSSAQAEMRGMYVE